MFALGCGPIVLQYNSWVVEVQDSQQQVGNGRAYAVCSCDGSESETSDKCGFRTADRAKMAVACDEGYAVKVGSPESTVKLLAVSSCVQHVAAAELGVPKNLKHLHIVAM